MKFKKINDFSNRFIRMGSSPLRSLPDFIIIGTQRGGTTSLYNYLIEHPNILPAYKKETHFFDDKFYRGMKWYRSNFPIKYCIQAKRWFYKTNFLTGEATPDYMFNPFVAEKIHSNLPNVKIIIILRNPVDRAYSHYHMNIRNGFEHLSFEDAIKTALEVYEKNKQRLFKVKNKNISFYPKYNYLARGRYIEQLKQWKDKFPEKNILIIKSEDFYRDIPGTLKKVFKFLNALYMEIKNFKIYHYGNNPKINPQTRKFLVEYYKPYNLRLYEYLGIDFNWDR